MKLINPIQVQCASRQKNYFYHYCDLLLITWPALSLMGNEGVINWPS